METTRKQLETLRRIGNQLLNLADQIDNARVDVPPDIQKEVERKINQRICLRCGQKIIEGDQVRRGLDNSCYSTTNKRINTGLENERTLILRGQITADPKPGGRPARLDMVAEAAESFSASRKKK